ncbi:MAG TPA: NusG domain II-containing protein [Spirochaetia bacterium]|nr:NusG domain II-containing protein [Spirochaetia bacterium]
MSSKNPRGDRARFGNRGFPLRILDILSIAMALGVVVLFTVQAYTGAGKSSEVSIQANGQYYLYPLDQDTEFSVSGPIGETTIQIRSHAVRVVSSPCRDKICIAAGWLSHSGQWTACLPNRVFVRVEGGDPAPVDAQTF